MIEYFVEVDPGTGWKFDRMLSPYRKGIMECDVCDALIPMRLDLFVVYIYNDSAFQYFVCSRQCANIKILQNI